MIKLLCFVLTGVFWAGAAQASTYFVTKPNDTFDGACDSDCSLREAVQAANLHPGADNIRLSAGTYTLTRPNLRELNDDGEPVPAEDPIHESDNVLGDLNVKDHLSVSAPFAAGTTISGGGLDRVFEVWPGVTFNANNLTITGGVASESGGGVYNAGTTTLTHSVVIGNHAEGFRDSGLHPHQGGGILNVGTLTLLHCQISYNSTFDRNYAEGGNIFNAGTLVVNRSLIAGGTVSDANDGGSGAGLANTGSAFITQSLFTANNADTQNGQGDAILNSGLLELTNTTISGNRVSFEGGKGALVNTASGTVRLSFVTIANNRSGGLRNEGAATVSASIIAGNPFNAAEPEPPDFHGGRNCLNSGTYTSQSSIVGLDGDCVADIEVDNATVFDWLLEPLALRGGATATHKPKERSLAVDAIDPSSAPGACVAIDQRSARRPPNDDGRRGPFCDVGAYELQR